jgi:hypothetical protein
VRKRGYKCSQIAYARGGDMTLILLEHVMRRNDFSCGTRSVVFLDQSCGFGGEKG